MEAVAGVARHGRASIEDRSKTLCRGRRAADKHKPGTVGGWMLFALSSETVSSLGLSLLMKLDVRFPCCH